jgi:hypothetical protein
MGFGRLDSSGWVEWSNMDGSALPKRGCVYVVVREASEPPTFLDASPAGWFKGRDPSVPIDRLTRQWVQGTPVIYVGKADNLRTRLGAYKRHGAGEPVGHWGGRFVWQCRDSEDHLVAWRTTTDRPADAESQLLSQFESSFGSLPFANLRH